MFFHVQEPIQPLTLRYQCDNYMDGSSQHKFLLEWNVAARDMTSHYNNWPNNCFRLYDYTLRSQYHVLYVIFPVVDFLVIFDYNYPVLHKELGGFCVSCAKPLFFYAVIQEI